MNKTFKGILLLLILALAVFFFVINPEKFSFLPQCPFHYFTGWYCPGCGSQRALHCLLHLDIAGVFSYNFLFLPAALFILYHYLHPLLNRWFKWNLPNLFYKKNTPWVVFVIVVVFWVVRNLPWYPFCLLAPG
jgi:hypothetical protein